MTATALLHVERDRARLWRADASTATEWVLDPLLPGGGLERWLREEAPTRVILVVGVSLLECTAVTLPPVDGMMRRRMLRADAGRFFALEGAVAAGSDGAVAWAMPAESLRAIRDAVTVVGPVDAVVALPVLIARAGLDGPLLLPATASTHGELRLRGGQLQSVRHVAGSITREPTPVDWAGLRTMATHRAWRVEDQLLDAEGEAAVRRREQRRWTWGSAAVLVAAVASLMAIDARQTRVQSSLTAAVAVRERATQDVQAAVRRFERARDELQLLDEPATPSSPLHIMAQLGTRLPSDVTLEALAWDGTTWELQGTARDAAALLPILTREKAFANVRTLAPSTRFLEQGRQRTAFRIGFEVAPPSTSVRPGGTDGR
jgi:hypothetical protein